MDQRFTRKLSCAGINANGPPPRGKYSELPTRLGVNPHIDSYPVDKSFRLRHEGIVLLRKTGEQRTGCPGYRVLRVRDWCCHEPVGADAVGPSAPAFGAMGWRRSRLPIGAKLRSWPRLMTSNCGPHTPT